MARARMCSRCNDGFHGDSLPLFLFFLIRQRSADTARVNQRCRIPTRSNATRFAARLLGAVFLVSVVVSPSQAGPQDMLALMQRTTSLAKETRYGEAVWLARKLVGDAEISAGDDRRGCLSSAPKDGPVAGRGEAAHAAVNRPPLALPVRRAHACPVPGPVRQVQEIAPSRLPRGLDP
ncbi:bll5959 [Bradyrhizobium diazoefficiens USDA 110]|uniref:Bll5959 protein n=1 Tax=Bradyrhizobium diazoefficiens (strain JCM 10833 / BCRC 13528 / IAM 13628 / NBRC 14792 / USDA 110) TaxID=224911 RepID=Q89HN1_BRADU|nr:hypothetical protein Bdiaspc4_31445 [Bradyrhizobium diazoefficiens]BAC51224.1 bll5959 [Bradyrhizobium diazoefficiens USDA 110]